MISARIFQAVPDGKSNQSGEVFILDESDGSNRPLPPRLDLRNHSPTGFAWGYGGSGPAQLALAILAEVTDKDFALSFYQDFKTAVIADKSGAFTITEEFVRGWLAGRKRAVLLED